jgi:hypothetical protein
LPASTVERSTLPTVRLPASKLIPAVLDSLGLDVSKSSLHRWQTSGKLEFSYIKGGMCSSVADVAAMIERDTAEEMKRRGIKPRGVKETEDEWLARAAMHQQALSRK